MRQISVATLIILAASLIFSTAIRASEHLKPVDDSIAIARLVLRDRIIVISEGKDGINYSVKDDDGTLLSANLNEVELQKKYPDIYEQVRPAYADGKKVPGLLMQVIDVNR